LLFLLNGFTPAQQTSTPFVSKVWVADNGEGTYKNPIIHADYSDPDVIRVGRDFYLTASSFNASPGLPILHSNDLVNWRIINYVFRQQEPADIFKMPQHGGGVWAPSLRYHAGEFYIFYPDPDRGIYMTKAKDPAGEWTKPVLVKKAKGWIDPCPFWDNDGKAYLVSAFVGSRASIKSVLIISRMSPDGTSLLDDGVMVFDGHAGHPTVEGPKFYKLNGYYYIFTPAGGVPTGWQLVLRSKNVYGPYEEKIVLAQGKTQINGPHQGALVDTPTGEWWFIHFQDRGPYGRIVHLEPVKWRDNFPVIGSDPDSNGTGQPVTTFKKPYVGRNYPIETPKDSDEFNAPTLGLQWQWQANPDPAWAFPFPQRGVLRMYSVERVSNFKNLWDAANLLLQKFPAEEFTATVKFKFEPRVNGEQIGLVIMGLDYSYLGVSYRGGKLFASQTITKDADKGSAEQPGDEVPLMSNDLYLRVRVDAGAVCHFSFSVDGVKFSNIGKSFQAREGRWIGARIGLFFERPSKTTDSGSADVDWFRFEK
jgi:beta-xylosidase